MSEDLVDVKGKVVDLTKTAQHSEGISLFTDATQQHYKSLVEYLGELADRWDEISEPNKNELLQLLFAKTRAQAGAAIITNFDQVRKAIEAMEDSMGSSDREMSIITDSITYKMNKLKETWTEVLINSIDKDDIKGFIDALTSISEGLSSIINNVGLLSVSLTTLGTVFGTLALGKNNTNIMKMIFNPAQNIMDQGNNRNFVNDMNELFASGALPTVDSINKRAQLENIHPKLVQAAQDFRNLSEEERKAQTFSQSFISGTEKGLVNLSGIVKKLGTTVGNMLFSFAASSIVSLIVTATVKIGKAIYDNVINKAETLQKAADEARDNIQNLSKAFDETKSTAEEAGKTYAELAQQVRNLGTVEQNQGDLSVDKYKEFLDVSNKLAELFPTLVKGYDENGNAILDLSGDVDTIVGSLNELVKAEEALTSKKIEEQIPEIWKNFDYSIEKTYEKIDEARQKFYGDGESQFNGYAHELETYYDLLKGIEIDSQSLQNTQFLKKAFSLADIDLTQYHSGSKNGKGKDSSDELLYDFTSLSEEQRKNVERAFKLLKADYDHEIKGYEDEIKLKNKDIGKSVLTAIQSYDDIYGGLNEAQQKMLSGYLSNFDYTSLLDEHKASWDSAFEEIKKRIMTSFSELDPTDKAMIQLYYSQLFSIDLSEGFYEENYNKVREYARMIAAIMGEEFSEVDVLKMLGFDSDKTQDVRDRLGYKTQVNNQYDARHNEEIDKFIAGLSQKDIELLATIDIDRNASLDNLKSTLTEMQKVASDTKITNEVKTVDDFDTMKSALNSLDSLYEQTVKYTTELGKNKKRKDKNGNVVTTNDNGQAYGYADPNLLNSVESAFGGLAKEDAKIADALEHFEKVMVETPNEAEEAQKAIDSLITSYIDQTDVLKDLTEENAEWAKAQLTAMGITNANDVVMSRLALHNKEVTKSLSLLNDKLKKNEKILSHDQGSIKDYNNALEDMRSDIEGALAIYNEDGSSFFSPAIDDNFIRDHMDDIKAMADGDIEALERVKRYAAEDAIMNVLIEIPSDVAETQMNQIMAMIDQANEMNIDIGATIDDGPFIQSLATMMKSSQQMSEAVQKSFEAMGYDVQWTPRTFKAIMMKTGKNVSSIYGPNGSQQVNWEPQPVDLTMPELTITRKGTAGAKAHYGGTPKTNSSSTGGNNSGSGSKDNSKKSDFNFKEIFDWIERKIKDLTTKAERWAKVIEQATDPKRVDKYYNKVEKSYEGLAKANLKAYNKYMSEADRMNKLDTKSVVKQIKDDSGYKLTKKDMKGLRDGTLKAGDIKNKKGKSTTATKNAAKSYLDWYKSANEYTTVDNKGNFHLKESYLEKARSGELKLEEIRNEAVAEALKNYEEWYDKSQDSLNSFMDNTETMFNTPLDAAAKKVEIFGQSIEKLNAELDNVAVDNYKYANDLINQRIKNQKKQTEANNKAQTEAQANFNTTYEATQKLGMKGVSKDGKELDMTKYTKGSKKWAAAYAYNTALKKLNEATQTAFISQQEFIKNQREGIKQQFDNIQTYYNEVINDLERANTKIQDELDLLEAKGELYNSSRYKSQKDIESQKIATRNTELTELLEKQKELEAIGAKNTQEWYDTVQAIADIEHENLESQKRIAELNKSIVALADKAFDRMFTANERLMNNLNFIDELADRYEHFDYKTANWTEAGLNNIATINGNMKTAGANETLARNTLDNLLAHYNNGDLSFIDINGMQRDYNSTEEFYQSILQYETKWQDAIKTRYEYENKAIEVMKEKYNQERSVLQDIVNLKKESINREKDLHNYQKSIQSATTNIGSLQKQIAALRGDNSTENQNRIQSLQAQLEKAQADLEETEYDRYLSDQQNMLDNLFKEYSDFIDEKLTHPDELLTQYNEQFGKTVGDVNWWVNDVLGVANGDLAQKLAAIIPPQQPTDANLGGTDNVDNNNGGGDNGGGETTTSTNTSPAPTPSTTPTISLNLPLGSIQPTLENDHDISSALGGNTTVTKAITTKIKDKTANAVTKWLKSNATYTGDPGSKLNKKIQALTGGKSLSKKNGELAALASYLGVKNDNDWSEKGNVYKELKKIMPGKFAKGGIAHFVKSQGEDGIAMVRQGEGILTPLQTDIFANQLVPRIDDIVDTGNIFKSILPHLTTRGGVGDNITATYQFTLENCSNAQDIIRSIQNDRNVQKALQDVTVNRIGNKSSRLTVNKY